MRKQIEKLARKLSTDPEKYGETERSMIIDKNRPVTISEVQATLKAARRKRPIHDEAYLSDLIIQNIKEDCRVKGKEYVMSAKNKIVVLGVAKWCLRKQDSPYNLIKGLWIQGNTGTGKTTFAEAVRKSCRMLQQETGQDVLRFGFINYEQLVDEIENNRSTRKLKMYDHHHMIFDDFYYQEKNPYINHKEVLLHSLIVSQAYNKRLSLLRIFTANFEINNFKSDRLKGRLRDVVTPIVWHGVNNQLR